MKYQLCLKLTLVVLLFGLGIARAQKNDIQTWRTNLDVGIKLNESDNYKLANKSFEISYLIAQKIFKKNDKRLGETLCELGNNYFKLEEYEKSINILDKALENVKLYPSKTNQLYFKILFILGDVYATIQEYDKAIPIMEEVLDEFKKTKEEENTQYYAQLSNLGDVYYATGQLGKALEMKNEALAYFEKKDGKESKSYAQELGNIGEIYYTSGRYEKARETIKEVLTLIEKTSGKDDPLYSDNLNNLGVIYLTLENFDLALTTCEIAAEMRKKIFGNKHLKYCESLRYLAEAHSNLGLYDKAIEEKKQALAIARENIKLDPTEFSTCLTTLADDYATIDLMEKALPLYLEAKENIEKVLGKFHPDYANVLSSLSIIYTRDGQYDKALMLLKESLEICEKALGKENKVYALHLLDLAKFYTHVKQYDDALPLYLEALQVTEKSLGKNHVDYANLVRRFADFYVLKGDNKEAIQLYFQSSEITNNRVNQIFKFGSENQKKAFLKSVSKNFGVYQSFSYFSQNKFDEIKELNLNNQIALKGLLLNSSKDILNKLNAINEEKINERIAKLKAAKNNLAKQYSLPLEQRKLNTDSLQTVINEFEVGLTRTYSERYKQSYELVNDWKLIQSKLKNNEVAIQFSNFKYYDFRKVTDSTIYVAYVIKREWPHPKVINLFEEKQLKTLLSQKSPNELYTSRGSKAVSIGADQDALYNLIWKPLAKEVENAKTIYYAPDGLLNQLSFAALQENGKPLLKKKHHLVQLSSTAVLVEQNIEPKPNNSLFIGGITYDYQIPENDDKKIESYASLDAESLKNTRGIRGIGDSWDYLPGTLKEVNEIETLYHENGKTYSSLTSDKATEHNFKALNGNSPNIIHFATHGFFFENVKQKSDKESSNQYKSSEDPLMRSGLILAGANYAWQHEGNPYEKEDGILTSLEISNLDLSKTDMVILSACDTGLGEIDGSEGVYGLQRAFKMAGVKIIVMSLWQVPDTETAEFMKLFYGHWLKGKTVREAFTKAQKTMYKKYPNDPLKWAGFVLFE